MLPDSSLTPEKAAKQPSMFADTGLRTFFDAIYGLRGDKRRMRVYIAGGANVLSGSDFFKIGERNVIAVRQFLQNERIPIVAEHVGGLNNRTLHFRINAGTVDLKTPDGLQTTKLV